MKASLVFGRPDVLLRISLNFAWISAGDQPASISRYAKRG